MCYPDHCICRHVCVCVKIWILIRLLSYEIDIKDLVSCRPYFSSGYLERHYIGLLAAWETCDHGKWPTWHTSYSAKRIRIDNAKATKTQQIFPELQGGVNLTHSSVAHSLQMVDHRLTLRSFYKSCCASYYKSSARCSCLLPTFFFLHLISAHHGYQRRRRYQHHCLCAAY